MTIHDFNQLDYESRINLLKTAVCIGQREGGNYTVMLYQLNGFYIEVFHHKKYCYIYVVEAFDDLSRLDVYVNTIQLPENNFQ
ncbi:MAG TPA: hypothetical protein VGN63_18690 [Flavisolibacter sp.]|jgi:cytidylate kinase|nr:hypothetical protein [Flavisolibacter sp.]